MNEMDVCVCLLFMQVYLYVYSMYVQYVCMYSMYVQYVCTVCM